MATAPNFDKAGTVAERPPPAKEKAGDYVTDDHVLTLEEIATKFGTDVNADQPKKSRGLTTAEAAARLLKYGPNALTPPKLVPQWLKYLIKLSNPLLLMLIGCGILSVATWGYAPAVWINLWLGLILFPVAFGTAFMTWLQVRRAAALQAP